ncbi:RNA polymerase sigma-70 factor [Arenibacter sp. M-2]|uniref:RNA polymerase sigma factor n=1 Tax=Arenibacter sp. M-2 TaxID=3053612 RepID=UPI002570B3DA|nr:RNA polymerase sigma-70 factor [Arenibacter sp. M-2]MDL5513954.1 RNA polymerase sigma-70 factor [Arenibacter sp. M-2]
MGKNDFTLLDNLKDGKEIAYRQLYNLYYNDLVIYCYNLIKDHDMAKDIVQQTFIKIWVKRESLHIHSTLKSYLYRTAYNTFLKEYQRTKREEIAIIELKNTALLSLIEDFDEVEGLLQERIKFLEMAISELPSKNKEVFLLSKKMGYANKEIAAKLGISKKAVEHHISRAKKSIRKWLEKNEVNLFIIFFRTPPSKSCKDSLESYP